MKRMTVFLKISVLLIIGLISQNYVFYKNNPVLFSKRPVLKILFPDTMDSESLLTAAKKWFLKTGGAVGFQLSDSYYESRFGIDELECGAGKLKNDEKTVYIESSDLPDPDCTAAACTYIVSCDDRSIIKSQIVLNKNGMAEYEDDPEHLWIHELGHLLGLNHLNAGDTGFDCEDGGSAGCNPPAANAMYRFGNDRSSEPGIDDLDGIIALYGERELPLPVTGPYAMSDEEYENILGIYEFNALAGLDTEEGRKAANQSLVNLVDFDEYRTEKSIQKRMEEFYVKVETQTETFNRKQLKLQRLMMMSGIVAGVDFKKDIENGLFQLNPDLIETSLSKQRAIRNRTIDRLREMGEIE